MIPFEVVDGYIVLQVDSSSPSAALDALNVPWSTKSAYQPRCYSTRLEIDGRWKRSQRHKQDVRKEGKLSVGVGKLYKFHQAQMWHVRIEYL